MTLVNMVKFWLYFLVAHYQLVMSIGMSNLSYNQPKLSPCAEWKPNDIINMDEDQSGYLMSIFINRNNTLYISDILQHRIFEWHEN